MTSSSPAEATEPYVGPRPFGRSHDDQRRFFARDAEAMEIESFIVSHPLLLVYAESGAGKTSLFNAKIAPDLEKRNFDVRPTVRLRVALPPSLTDVANIYELATILSLDSGSKPKDIAKLRLVDHLRSYQKNRRRGTDKGEKPSPSLIVFDQFEELFSFEKVFELFPTTWEEQRRDFFRAITTALNEDPLLRVVMLIREDYLAQLEPYGTLLPEGWRIRLRLERLREEPALEAVRGPLRETQRRYVSGADVELVRVLLTERVDLGFGETADIKGNFVEPVQLQLVCQGLWRNLPEDVKEIGKEQLDLGDVDQILARFYEESVAAASSRARIGEDILRRFCGTVLITAAGTRGTAFRGKDRTESIPNAAIDELERLHLIRAEWRANARWYELVHDRFIKPITMSNDRFFGGIKELDAEKRAEMDERARRLFSAATQAFEEGSYAAAISHYRESLAVFEALDDQWETVSVRLDLAYALLAIDDVVEADQLIQAILRSDTSPWHAAFARFLSGGVLVQKGRREEAVDVYFDAIASYRALGDHESVLRITPTLDRLLGDLGRYVEANSIFEEALTAATDIRDSASAYYELMDIEQVYFGMEEFDRAAEVATAAGTAAAARSQRFLWIDALYSRAVALWYGNNHVESRNDFDLVLRERPDDLDALSGRGQVLAEMGESLLAVQDLEKALEDTRGSTTTEAYALSGLGLAYAQLGRESDAQTAFSESIRREPNNAWVYFNRATAAEYFNHFEGAVEDYESSLSKEEPPLNAWKRLKAAERLSELRGQKRK